MPKIKKLTVDFSTLNEFRLCPRKAILNYIYGYKRVGARFSGNLYKGKVLHKYLEHLYQGLPIAFGDWCREQGIPEAAPELQDIGRAYAQFYQARHGFDAEFTPLKQEHRIDFHLTENIYFGGSIDQLGRTNAGELFIGDNKCSSSVERYVYPKIDVSEQFTGYAWLATKELGEPVSLVMVNGISLDPKVKGTDKFSRRWTVRTQWQVDEWLNNTIYWAKLLRDSIESGFAGTACDHGLKTFNTECHLASFCKADPADRAAILSAEYQVEPWEGATVEWDQ